MLRREKMRSIIFHGCFIDKIAPAKYDVVITSKTDFTVAYVLSIWKSSKWIWLYAKLLKKVFPDDIGQQNCSDGSMFPIVYENILDLARSFREHNEW